MSDRHKRLENKVAIITGAARGQGAAEARLFIDEGASVIISDVLVDEGSALAEELGAAATFVEHDISSEGGWASAVAAATKAYGALDILINNASFYQPLPLAETTVQNWQRHIDVNQTGVLLGLHAASDALAAAGAGSVVNVASTVALRGYAGMYAYQATKWAVRGMSRAAARELAPRGVRVNTIFPGLIQTAMLGEQSAETTAGYAANIPLGRIGQPEDIAPAVLFLASDESSFITGAEIVIDGGSQA
jgi:3alpha(or 20beta)-hydroxysteroid dehydrogenase